LLSILFAFSAIAHAQVPASPTFEVATVKRNTACGSRPAPGSLPSPGRLSLSCFSLRRLVSLAYGGFSGGAIRLIRPDVLEGPAWADSDLYDIEAKASGPAPFDQVYGVML